jgi:hypothetical protein
MRFFRIWNACLGMTPQTEEESLVSIPSCFAIVRSRRTHFVVSRALYGEFFQTAQEWVLINEQVRDLAPTENFVPHNRNH